jgi:hypothetical protein
VRRTLAVAAAAGLLALGCSGGEEEILDLQATPGADSEPIDEPADPEPEVEETEESAEQPEPEDPYAVPDEIDEEYVERVINAILEVQSEILRGALQQEQGENLDPDLMALHFATTDGAQRLEGLDYFQDYIDNPDNHDFRDTDALGDMTFSIDQLIHAEQEKCLIAIGRWDVSAALLTEDNPDERVVFSLSRTDEGAEVSEGNPTPWQWRDNGILIDTEGEPIGSEYWNDLDYNSAMDHTCERL